MLREGDYVNFWINFVPVYNNLTVGTTENPGHGPMLTTEELPLIFITLPMIPIIPHIQMLFIFIWNSYDASPRPVYITLTRKTHM